MDYTNETKNIIGWVKTIVICMAIVIAMDTQGLLESNDIMTYSDSNVHIQSNIQGDDLKSDIPTLSGKTDKWNAFVKEWNSVSYNPPVPRPYILSQTGERVLVGLNEIKILVHHRIYEKFFERGDIEEYRFGNYWYKYPLDQRDNKKLHGVGDLPAIMFSNGDNYWYKEGKRHRDGGNPAVEKVNGDKEWWKDGVRHRDGGNPAVVKNNGDREWWRNGKRYRDGNLPHYETSNGDRIWYRDDGNIRKHLKTENVYKDLLLDREDSTQMYIFCICTYLCIRECFCFCWKRRKRDESLRESMLKLISDGQVLIDDLYMENTCLEAKVIEIDRKITDLTNTFDALIATKSTPLKLYEYEYVENDSYQRKAYNMAITKLLDGEYIIRKIAEYAVSRSPKIHTCDYLTNFGCIMRTEVHNKNSLLDPYFYNSSTTSSLYNINAYRIGELNDKKLLNIAIIKVILDPDEWATLTKIPNPLTHRNGGNNLPNVTLYINKLINNKYMIRD